MYDREDRGKLYRQTWPKRMTKYTKTWYVWGKDQGVVATWLRSAQSDLLKCKLPLFLDVFHALPTHCGVDNFLCLSLIRLQSLLKLVLDRLNTNVHIYWIHLKSRYSSDSETENGYRSRRRRTTVRRRTFVDFSSLVNCVGFIVI